MKGWRDIRKKYKATEIVGILGVILCFLVGGFFDWKVKNGNILIEIKDIDTFSLTLLQIQATISTLAIAIIALITGNISDSYMGVSVSDYYLNIRPWALKQKILIFISLCLSMLSVIFYLLKQYNTVFYLFIATLIAVSISITEIYTAFRGKNTENIEIEAYINYILDGDYKFQKKENIYKNFVQDWKNDIDNQDIESYEEYTNIFIKSMNVVLEYETDQSLACVQQQCYSMAYCLLGSEKIISKERGIEFIQAVYDVIWAHIYKNISQNKSIINKYKYGFYLLAEIGGDLMEAIGELNIEKVEKKYRFDHFSDSIQRISIWTKSDVECSEGNIDKNRYENEMRELCYMARYIGHYLQKQKDKNSIINYRFWGNFFSSWNSFSSYNIPEERREEFLKVKSDVYFNYCYGLIMNSQENILEVGLYLKGLNNTYILDNKYHALIYLIVHCFIYYLADRESADCVSDDTRKSAKYILYNDKVKGAFLRYLRMLSEKKEWLDLEMKNQIYRTLDRFELFPQYSSSKTMIMEHVVTDFYLFIILYMYHEYYMPELIETNIDDMEVFRYVSQGNEEHTKELFFSLYNIIYVGNKSDSDIKTEIGLMYDSLEKMVRKKQKERYIESARREQQKYEQTINEEDICIKMESDITKQLKDKFAPILVDEDDKNGIIRINLLRLIDYTTAVDEKNIDGYYSHVNGSFLLGVVNFLYTRDVIEKRNRFDDFVDDREYMNYLSENKLQLILGSQYILSNKNYKLSSEFKDFLEDFTTIYTSVINVGIALKENAIRVCLHDVNVSIHSPGVKETSAKYDNVTGKYIYSIVDGLPIDFEESELKEFLYNNRKVINVTAKVSIQVNEKPVGVILEGRNTDSIR